VLRWIGNLIDEEYVGDGPDGHRFEWCESYFEVDPRKVVHDLLYHQAFGNRLPPELETYREFGDTQRYNHWFNERVFGYTDDESNPNPSPGPEPRRPIPSWDRDQLVLTYNGALCVKFRRAEGNGQIRLLDAFEAAGWPDIIRNPLGSAAQLRETVK